MTAPNDGPAALHESAFVRSFIIRERRDRYIAKLANPKQRAAFLDRLNHQFHRDIDNRFVCESPDRKIPDGDEICYLIASEREFDGRLVAASDVPEILSSAYFGIIVSYVPGKLAAYKDEAWSDLTWLQR